MNPTWQLTASANRVLYLVKLAVIEPAGQAGEVRSASRMVAGARLERLPPGYESGHLPTDVSRNESKRGGR